MNVSVSSFQVRPCYPRSIAILHPPGKSRFVFRYPFLFLQEMSPMLRRLGSAQDAGVFVYLPTAMLPLRLLKERNHPNMYSLTIGWLYTHASYIQIQPESDTETTDTDHKTTAQVGVNFLASVAFCYHHLEVTIAPREYCD